MRPLPRLTISVASAAGDERVVAVRPILDNGAEHTVLDGTVALDLGWSEQNIARTASGARPITGVGRAAAPLVGYQHSLNVLISVGQRYAMMQLSLFLTLPNTLAMPVLGRRNFFRQVDFALIEAEQRFCLRFRDRSVLQDSWG